MRDPNPRLRGFRPRAQKHRLPSEEEERLGVTFHPDAESLVRVCDVVTINAPLHPETEGLFDDELLGTMRRGTYLINTARGKICDATRSFGRSRAASSPATPAMSGTPSPLRRIIPGGRCPTTG